MSKSTTGDRREAQERCLLNTEHSSNWYTIRAWQWLPMAMLVALSLALLPTHGFAEPSQPEARQPYDTYPLIANQWGNIHNAPGTPPYLSPDQSGKYDLLTPGDTLWNLGELQNLRARNPRQLLLFTAPLLYDERTGSLMNQWKNATPGTSEYCYLMRNTSGQLLGEPGWHDAFYNLTNPSVVQRLSDQAIAQFQGYSTLFDGFYFDQVHAYFSLYITLGYAQNVDSDCNGQADDVAGLDSRWLAGVNGFMQRLRTTLPGVMIEGSEAREVLQGQLNGRAVEWEPRQIASDVFALPWTDLLSSLTSWMQVSVSPHTTLLEGAPAQFRQQKYGILYGTLGSNVPSAVFDDARTQYRYMRFGLGMALLAGTYFTFDWGDTLHGEPWWYDEYDNGGRGRGYLGRPVGAARLVYARRNTPNLVQNGSFESGNANNWSFYAHDPAQAQMSVEPSAPAGSWAAHVRVTQIVPGSYQDWRVELFSDPFAVSQFQEYGIAFYAKASTPRVLRIQVKGADEPHTQLSNYIEVNLSSEWQRFHYQFIASRNEPRARLNFDMGAAVSDVRLDDVLLQSGSLELMQRDFEHGTVLVNASHNVEIIGLGQTYRHLSGQQAPLDQQTSLAEAGRLVTAGAWQSRNAEFAEYGQTVQFANGGSGATGTFYAGLLTSGAYQIYAWRSGLSGRATARYTLVAGNASQDVSPSGTPGWVPIGTTNFNAGWQPVVNLSAASGGDLVADAVKLESVARLNDGSATNSVTVGPLDAVILVKNAKHYFPLINRRQ